MSSILPKKLNKTFKKLTLLILGPYIMVGSVLYFLQETFLFRPESLSQDHVYNLEYDFEEHFLRIDDETIINSLHIKAEAPQGAIIYYHGNAGNLERWSAIVTYFVDLGYDVYVMDYRTYGKSTGKLSEKALYNDAQKCYDHLKQFWNEKDIIVYGRSLGSAMASKIASMNNPKKLILESPFYNIADVAKQRFPIFPTKRMLSYKLPNNEHIKEINCPISIFHGTNDMVVPFSSGEKLFHESKKGKTTLTIIENGGHNDLIEFDDYHDQIKKILLQDS